MKTKSILKMGDNRLYKRSQLITDFSDPSLTSIIAAMHEAMEKYHGVGIAAPQIGINKRIIIFGFDKNPRYPNESSIPRTLLINPHYELLSNKTVDGWEGCLSIPGMRGLVPRYHKIRYHGYSQDGTLITREVTGFHARVVQHECDHINGILFPLRINNMKMFGFEDTIKYK